MRLVIVDDSALVRGGLALLLKEAGIEVVGAVGTVAELTSLLRSQDLDAVILDIRMPPTFTDEGARAARELKQQHPDLGVLVLSQHIETTHTIDLIPLAGFGYLLKDRVLEVDDFLSAAERVARGGSALDPHVVATLLSGRRRDDPLAALTDRERTVLELMAEGLTNTGIAKRLHLSERTIEAHVRHLLTKLNMPDSEDDHRRVHAVLTHLSATQP